MDETHVYTTLANLGVGIVIALITAYVTVRLATQRFRTEQWWTRKADAYKVLLDALHRVKSCDTKYLTELMQGRPFDEQSRSEILKVFREADLEVRKAIDTGSFIFCPEAMEVLRDLSEGLKQADRAETFDEHLEMELHAVEECLRVLPDIAKKDLNVKVIKGRQQRK